VGFIEYVDTTALASLGDYTNLTDVALRRKLEPAAGLYIAESSKVISRAIAAGHSPKSVLCGAKFADSILGLVDSFEIPVFVAPDELIERVTGYDVHRGALAAMVRPELLSVETVLQDARLVVILENLVDHTNVGAIFRAVAAMGADAVLITPECADPFYRRSIRVSMGTVLQVPWTRLSNWPASIDEVRAAGFLVAAFALREDSLTLREFAAQRHEKVAIVLGAEGDGLSARTLANVDTVVQIPMHHGVDSLNVASAAAVALYALT
jgi:tRNA G18 (ribose-2'-O)-methylase SpoU